jgi:hypothetical protein
MNYEVTWRWADRSLARYNASAMQVQLTAIDERLQEA